MHLISTLAIAIALQQPQALAPDSAVRAFLMPRVAAFPDSGKHGTGIVVGLLDASGARRIVSVGVDSAGVFEIGSITKVFTTSVL
jgi:CubicO group peptidase (beta-lactamase class C family)